MFKRSHLIKIPTSVRKQQFKSEIRFARVYRMSILYIFLCKYITCTCSGWHFKIYSNHINHIHIHIIKDSYIYITYSTVDQRSLYSITESHRNVPRWRSLKHMLQAYKLSFKRGDWWLHQLREREFERPDVFFGWVFFWDVFFKGFFLEWNVLMYVYIVYNCIGMYIFYIFISAYWCISMYILHIICYIYLYYV